MPSVLGCSDSKLQFMPAVDMRGYPVKGSCVLSDVGLVAVFDALANPQPGTAAEPAPFRFVMCSKPFAAVSRPNGWRQLIAPGGGPAEPVQHMFSMNE